MTYTAVKLYNRVREIYFRIDVRRKNTRRIGNEDFVLRIRKVPGSFYYRKVEYSFEEVSYIDKVVIAVANSYTVNG